MIYSAASASADLWRPGSWVQRPQGTGLPGSLLVGCAMPLPFVAAVASAVEPFAAVEAIALEFAEHHLQTPLTLEVVVAAAVILPVAAAFVAALNYPTLAVAVPSASAHYCILALMEPPCTVCVPISSQSPEDYSSRRSVCWHSS